MISFASPFLPDFHSGWVQEGRGYNLLGNIGAATWDSASD